MSSIVAAVALLSLATGSEAREAQLNGLTAAAALRANPPQPFSDCSNTSGRSPATGLPPTQCYKSPFDTTTVVYNYGAKIAPTEAYAARIKTAITLPPLVLRANVAVCLGFVDNYPCPLQLTYPRADPSVTYGYFGIAGQAYVQSPAGVEPRYGVFPPTQVHTLAFGSIPVSAEVELRQPLMPDGYAAPLKVDFVTSAGAVTVGAYIPGYEGYGPAPPLPGGQVFWNPPPHISGRVDVQISNLRVDGRPVDVGARCASPAQLLLTARGGFYNSTGTTPGDGNPGEYSPLAPQGNSYLHGYLDIPAFRSCGVGGDDLAPLISSFVSGSGTAVNVTQLGPLQPFCTLEPHDPTCLAPTAARASWARRSARVANATARLPAPVRRSVERLFAGP